MSHYSCSLITLVPRPSSLILSQCASAINPKLIPGGSRCRWEEGADGSYHTRRHLPSTFLVTVSHMGSCKRQFPDREPEPSLQPRSGIIDGIMCRCALPNGTRRYLAETNCGSGRNTGRSNFKPHHNHLICFQVFQ